MLYNLSFLESRKLQVMFETLKPLTADPILGLMAEFRNDSRGKKIDLGVGIYRDENGDTPIMVSVAEAEKKRIKKETTKAYIGPAGSESFNLLTQKLTLGNNHTAIKENRLSSVQTPGGCGALRVGAELIKRANPACTIWVSEPTWANHIPLLGNTGLKIVEYPYYSPETQSLRRQEMFEKLKTVPANDIVLVHGCCHNPCGVDLGIEDWETLVELVNKQGFIPFVDLAYQGLGKGLSEDTAGLRFLADNVPELIIATSYSKNFGLYRERVGALQVVNQSAETAPVTQAQLGSTVRGIYSMPPAHGAAIVETILADKTLYADWDKELRGMRERINSLRRVLAETLTEHAERDFSFISEQRGMFSFLGLTQNQISELKETFGIYMVDSSRINVAGINDSNIDHFIESMAQVLRK